MHSTYSIYICSDNYLEDYLQYLREIVENTYYFCIFVKKQGSNLFSSNGRVKIFSSESRIFFVKKQPHQGKLIQMEFPIFCTLAAFTSRGRGEHATIARWGKKKKNRRRRHANLNFRLLRGRSAILKRDHFLSSWAGGGRAQGAVGSRGNNRSWRNIKKI